MLQVLVVGDNLFRLREQLTLCEELLIVNPHYRFTFLINNSTFTPIFANLSEKISFILIGKSQQADSTNQKTTKIEKNLQKPQKNIRNSIPFFIYELISFFLLVFYLYKNYFKIRKIIHNIKPDLILTNADRNNGIEQIVLKIAHEEQITVIIPYLAYSDNVGLAELRSRKDFFTTRMKNSFLTPLFMRLFPLQVYNYKKSKYLFHPPSFTLAYKLFGTLSERPWYVGNGLSDIVCVDTKNSYNRHIKNGVPAEKLIIIGDVSFDKVYKSYTTKKSIKKSIISSYNLNKKKKIIIISLPQLAEMDFINWKDHWNEIDYLMKTIQQLNCNVLLSLHPRMNPAHYQLLEKKYDCHIVTERLFKIIPIADLFISTYSSTVIWAVLSGIKCVIVDFYGLQYRMFDFLNSITIVRDKVIFRQRLHTTMQEQVNFDHDWKKLSRKFSFDGNTIKRYNDLFTTHAIS